MESSDSISFCPVKREVVSSRERVELEATPPPRLGLKEGKEKPAGVVRMIESSSMEFGVGGAELAEELEHVWDAENVGEGVSSLSVTDSVSAGSRAFGVGSEELGPDSGPPSLAAFIMSAAQRG